MTSVATEREGTPFTVRLTPAVEHWLNWEASRSKRPRGAVLEELLEEAIRVRRFPGVAFRGPAHDRRACLMGTALDVWEIIEAVQAMGVERLLADGDVPERQVQLAISYYREYPREIDQAIKESRRSEAEWRALLPSSAPPAR